MNMDPSRLLEFARESLPPREDEFIAKLTTLLRAFGNNERLAREQLVITPESSA